MFTFQNLFAGVAGLSLIMLVFHLVAGGDLGGAVIWMLGAVIFMCAIQRLQGEEELGVPLWVGDSVIGGPRAVVSITDTRLASPMAVLDLIGARAVMPSRSPNLGVLASGCVPPILHVAYGVALSQRLGYVGVILLMSRGRRPEPGRRRARALRP